jgi:alcohol dehydrogenase (cytochrome c)
MKPGPTLAFGVNWGGSAARIGRVFGRLFRGTPDGYLLALDASTGRLLWPSLISDATLGEFVTGAPLPWNGLVFVRITGSDGSIKGRVMASDWETLHLKRHYL